MAIARVLISFLGITATLALPNSRIWGGNDATSGQFPWVASVRLDNAHVCVGNIIDNLHIITAGHCVSEMGTKPYDFSRVNARVGSFNQYAAGQIVGIENIIIHPAYGDFMHDLAILKLKEPLMWSDKLKSIELAQGDEEITKTTDITVSGWGLLASGSSPYKLQHLTMNFVQNDECEYRAGYGYDSVMCLDRPEGQGICRGDDGAGAVANNRLVGVMSFAFGSCGSKYPDVASKVAYYLTWIQAVVSDKGL